MTVRLVSSGGKGTGVNPRGTDFPFVSPSSDLDWLIADAYLAYEDAATLPLRLSSITGLHKAFDSASASSGDSQSSVSGAAGNPVDVVIVDADDTVIFDSAVADYVAADFGDRLRIHEWRSDIAVCRVVQHTAFHQTEDAVVVPATLEPVNGELDSRVSMRMPERVTSLRVGVSVIDESITLQAGYNMTLDLEDAATTGLRSRQHVLVSAVAGTGLGRFNNCEAQELYIKRINQVAPGDNGDFLLAAHDCYWVRQPAAVVTGPRTVTPTEAALQFGNDCAPCCECEDFVSVYAGVRRVRDRFAAIGATAESTRDLYHDNRDRWLAAKDCVESNVVRVVTFPHQNFIEIGVAICNLTQECATDIEMELLVTVNCDDPPAPVVVACSTLKSDVRGQWEYYQMSTVPADQGSSSSAVPESGPPWYAAWDALNPGYSARLRTRLEFPADMDCSVTVTAKGWISDVLVGEDTGTTRLVQCDV
jgi:hypothetical protein